MVRGKHSSPAASSRARRMLTEADGRNRVWCEKDQRTQTAAGQLARIPAASAVAMRLAWRALGEPLFFSRGMFSTSSSSMTGLSIGTGSQSRRVCDCGGFAVRSISSFASGGGLSSLRYAFCHLLHVMD